MWPHEFDTAGFYVARVRKQPRAAADAGVVARAPTVADEPAPQHRPVVAHMTVLERARSASD